MFALYLKSFFIRNDAVTVAIMKINILTNLASSVNISAILREFSVCIPKALFECILGLPLPPTDVNADPFANCGYLRGRHTYGAPRWRWSWPRLTLSRAAPARFQKSPPSALAA
jgi:hypothetical protein